MTTLAFDGRMGASGDMLLGALLAAGADRSALDPVEDALGVEYDVSRTKRCGIAATAVEVLLDGRDDAGPDGHHPEQSPTAQAEGAGPHRTYTDVVGIVESMSLPESVEARALAMFERLGRAEARIHDTTLEDTQFHEVGADDAIADVVGVSLLLADLDPVRIVTTPLSAGGGEVSMSHGVYPVPPPAVVEIAEGADWSLRGGPVETELLTPTGAAILAEVADGVASLPSMDVLDSGYGAGSKTFDQRANVLRAVVGREQGVMQRDPITVLETNLDDATPETLGTLQETLSAVGALDVTVLPATMKKSRPGHLLKVIVKPEDAERVARTLAAETGTLGVREHGSGHRFVANRRTESVSIQVGDRTFEVAVKVARFDGEAGTVFDVSAESDDAVDVARQTELPVREVRRRAEATLREQLD